MEGKIKICLNFGFVEIGKVTRPFGFTLIRLAFSQTDEGEIRKAMLFYGQIIFATI